MFSWIFVFLSMCMCSSVIVGGLLEIKLIEIFGVQLTAGCFFIPVLYILNDIISEVYGYAKTRKVIFASIFLFITSSLLLNFAALSPSPLEWDGASHFNYIFGLAPRVAIAGCLATFFGSLSNAKVMFLMKEKLDNFGFKARAIVSTLIGEYVDSVVFYCVAFLGIIPFIELSQMIIIIPILKIIIEILILPMTHFIVEKVKHYESIIK